jgi:serine kinase of HPr protein (carbohydrate metabolism regulator)
MKVLYNLETRTAFLFNFDYYGWVKSIALAIASDILEDAHGVNHVHGAALDVGGTGITFIAPSKTGKTTHSWGILRLNDARLITDDWYFVKNEKGSPLAIGSERNCYIDADIGDVWEEYRPLVTTTKFDEQGRGIANVRWITGHGSVIPMTTLKHVIMLRRDPKEKIVETLEPNDAWEYLKMNDLCNPHQMIRNDRKMMIRERFFKKFFGNSSVSLINTTGTPDETQNVIRNIILKQ